MGISEMAEPEKVPTAAKPDNLSLVPGPLYGGRRGPDSCQLSFDLHPRVMRQPPTNFFLKKEETRVPQWLHHTVVSAVPG